MARRTLTDGSAITDDLFEEIPILLVCPCGRPLSFGLLKPDPDRGAWRKNYFLGCLECMESHLIYCGLPDGEVAVQTKALALYSVLAKCREVMRKGEFHVPRKGQKGKDEEVSGG